VRLASGSDLQLLDIVEIRFRQHCPVGCQVENCLYDAQRPWEKVGTFDPADLPKLADSPSDIWGTGSGWYNSTVPYPQSEQLNSSLLLIKAVNARMVVKKWEDSDTSVSVDFHYGGDEYSFKVTDPAQKQRFIRRGPGTYTLGSGAHICVSLAEPYGAFRYKLAAAVYTKQGPV
jgi:hypothetical protein